MDPDSALKEALVRWSAASPRPLVLLIASRADEILQDDFVDRVMGELLEKYGPDSALKEALVRWSAASPRPLVLLIDEIDSLVGDTLISVLRQIRAGYDRRPRRFPQSVVLCGVRDVRDYRIYSGTDQNYILGGSAFNIKAESLRLGDLKGEVNVLLRQHTAETCQTFELGALERMWELTCGQPWLVNALARQTCFKQTASRDRSRPIDGRAVEEAKETLVLERATHLDQLADKLREGRVRRVIEPILAAAHEHSYQANDLEYVRDLGLVARDDPVRIANPIYAEVVPRELTSGLQEALASVGPWYVNESGDLDADALLAGFQEYFRQHSEHWVEQFGYGEAGPQLVLHGYLQRVANGGGSIEREYALGRGRTDLLITWPTSCGRWPERTSKHVIECKVLRKGRGLDGTIKDGLSQTAGYMDRCGAQTGHLVIFDQRGGKSWEERNFRRQERTGGTTIAVWGM